MCLTLLAITSTIGLSACAHTPAHIPIGCAEPPELVPMNQDMRDRTDDDVVQWFSDTLEAAKAYGIENCRRIQRHDEAME